jgi:hypothetical protein
METLELFLPVCSYDKCVIYVSVSICWFLGCKAYGLLFKKIHIKVGYYQCEGGTHGNAVSLAVEGAIVKKICHDKDLPDERSCQSAVIAAVMYLPMGL